MLQAPSRAAVPAATLPRLLARLAGADATPAPQPPAAQLGDWLEWPRAVALARALGGPLTAVDASADDVDPAACAQARAGLAEAIASERGWPDAGASTQAAADTVRRHSQSLQRAMQAATGRLRGQLRDRLARQSASHARLAAVDAVFEGMLSPREHALLAPVPALLAAHCERLRAADDDASGRWHPRLLDDARQVLLAELDLRFQPVDALCAALHPASVDA